jgi:hypothetical protein
MAACAWNMAKWMRDAILFLFGCIILLIRAPRTAMTEIIIPLKLSGEFLVDFGSSERWA